MNTRTEEHDREAFERAIATTRRFVIELQRHCDAELARTALLAVALESHEQVHGRKQLTAWLGELSARLATEPDVDRTH